MHAALPLLDALELEVPLPEEPDAPELPELPELAGACGPPEPDAVAPEWPASAAGPEGVPGPGMPAREDGVGSVGACVVSAPVLVPSVVPTAHARRASAESETTNGARTRARADKAFSFGCCSYSERSRRASARGVC